MARDNGPPLGSVLMCAGGVAKRRWPELLASMVLVDTAAQVLLVLGASQLLPGGGTASGMALAASVRLAITLVFAGLVSGFTAALLLADQRGEADPRGAALRDVGRAWPLLMLAAFVLLLPSILVQVGGPFLLGRRSASALGLFASFAGLVSLILIIALAPIYAVAVDPMALRRGRLGGLAYDLARAKPWLLTRLFILVMLPVIAVTAAINFTPADLPLKTPLFMGISAASLLFGLASAAARQGLALVYAGFYWERTQGARSKIVTADVFD